MRERIGAVAARRPLRLVFAHDSQLESYPRARDHEPCRNILTLLRVIRKTAILHPTRVGSAQNA